jgi:hypothetical protein
VTDFDARRERLHKLGVIVSPWRRDGYLVQVPAWQITRVFHDIQSLTEFIERIERDFPRGIRKPRR